MSTDESISCDSTLLRSDVIVKTNDETCRDDDANRDRLHFFALATGWQSNCGTRIVRVVFRKALLVLLYT